MVLTYCGVLIPSCLSSGVLLVGKSVAFHHHLLTLLRAGQSGVAFVMPADSACSKTAVNSIELHQQEEKLEQKHLPRRTRLDAGRIPWVSQSL